MSWGGGVIFTFFQAVINTLLCNSPLFSFFDVAKFWNFCPLFQLQLGAKINWQPQNANIFAIIKSSSVIDCFQWFRYFCSNLMIFSDTSFASQWNIVIFCSFILKSNMYFIDYMNLFKHMFQSIHNLEEYEHWAPTLVKLSIEKKSLHWKGEFTNN